MANIVVGSGSDSLVLKVSQDYYRANAQYTVKVDGVQIGGTLSAFAQDSLNQLDTVTIKGDWGVGAHTVRMSFLNDVAGRGGDRNLFLDSATENGVRVQGADLDFYVKGTQSFTFNDNTPVGTSPPPPPPPQPIEPPPPPAGDSMIHLIPGMNIQNAVNAAPVDAHFYLEPGEYRMQSITPKDGQDFTGADGAVLNGSRLLTSFTAISGDWYASGQTQQGVRNATDEGLPGFDRAGFPDAVYIDNVAQKPVDTRGEVVPGTYFFDYAADRIYIGTNPSGHKVEAAVTPVAFNGSSSVDGVVITNLVVEKYATPAQVGTIGGPAAPAGWIVQDSEIRLNYGVGVDLGSNSKILNNNIHDNGQMGMAGGGANLLVEGNKVHHNGFWSGIDPDWEGGGSKFTITQDLMVRNNHVHDNAGYGLWTDIDNVRTTYVGNLVENNAFAGINHEISYSASIHDNTLIGNGAGKNEWGWGAGIQVQNSQDVEIYSNTVDTKGKGNGITLIQQDRSDVEVFGGTAPFGPYVTADNSVHDNIIAGAGISGALADFNEAGMLAANNSFEGNDYRVPDVGDDIFTYGDEYAWTQFRQLSGWEDAGTISPL